jgi:hypothetical protein
MAEKQMPILTPLTTRPYDKPAPDFPLPFPHPGPLDDVRGVSDALSDLDLRTLRRVLTMIRAARADARSTDKAVATAGERRLWLVLHYAIGFLDGKGLSGGGPSPGFANLFQAELGSQDPQAALDDVEKALDSVLGDTRLTVKQVGLLLIGAGVALKGIAAAIS